MPARQGGEPEAWEEDKVMSKQLDFFQTAHVPLFFHPLAVGVNEE